MRLPIVVNCRRPSPLVQDRGGTPPPDKPASTISQFGSERSSPIIHIFFEALAQKTSAGLPGYGWGG